MVAHNLNIRDICVFHLMLMREEMVVKYRWCPIYDIYM